MQTEVFRDYTSVADGTRRETQFTIDQSEAAIRAFYRTELTTHGWTYQGRFRPTCGSYVLGPTDVEDLYDHGGRTLSIHIVTPDPQQSRHVYVVEYQGQLRHPMQPTPMPTPRLPTTLIGDWQTRADAPDRTWTLCVYEQGVVHVVGPGSQSLSGRYQWDDDRIQVTLDTAALVNAAAPGRPGDGGRCSDLSAVFQDGCQSRRIDPASYPGPDGVIRPTPTVGPRPTMGPYPPSMPPVTERVQIEVMFAVRIERDTLTLTNGSGVVQTFRRVTQ